MIIWSAWQFTEKNHIIERYFRLTEISFFLLPLSAFVFSFVLGSQVVSSTSNEFGQAGAALGAAIGGTFVVVLSFIIGLTGGVIMHLVTNKYDKKAEASGVKQLESLSNKHGVILSLVAVIVLAIIMGSISSDENTNTNNTKTENYFPNADYVDYQDKLELLNYKCYKQYDFFYIEGQVKNITDKSLENVEVVGSAYTESGGFVTSDEALIKYTTILAGQTSPFTVMISDNPEISRCNVEFKELFGGTIPTKRSIQ